MTPLSVFLPEAMEVAVEAESGQKEVLSYVVTLPTSGNWVKLSSASVMAPLLVTVP